jgi:hypothetical protein
LRRERVFAAGDRIEGAHLAPQVEHHGAERIAGQCVGANAQRHLGIRCLNQHDAARIEAEFGNTRHCQHPRFAGDEILPDPEQRPAFAQPLRDAGDEARGRAGLPRLESEHLMQRAAHQPALQRRVGVGMSKRNARHVGGIHMRFDAFDAAAQARKRIHACALHAPLLKNLAGSGS